MTFKENDWFHLGCGTPGYEVSTKEELLSLPPVKNWEDRKGHWEISVDECLEEDDGFDVTLMWVANDLKSWYVVLECDNATPKDAESAKTWLPIWKSENMRRED